MRTPYHDILVLTGNKILNEAELQTQVRMLNGLLFHVENLSVFCNAHEILDANNCKIITKQHLIQQVISNRTLPPFVFINNKN